MFDSPLQQNEADNVAPILKAHEDSLLSAMPFKTETAVTTPSALFKQYQQTGNVLFKDAAGVAFDTLKNIGKGLSGDTKYNPVAAVVEKTFGKPNYSMLTAEGKLNTENPVFGAAMGALGAEGSAAKVAPSIFKGFTDLSTSLLEKLKGRSTVSKQFISDLSNSADLKQPEKDLVRSVLQNHPDTVDVNQFANDVKTQLLPLESTPGISNGAPKYESINLPPDLRGPVANYKENIYQSPIQTSAGNVHFNAIDYPSYFAHTRIEDLPGDTFSKITSHSETPKRLSGTRRVIELQSDLFQKGRLEGSLKANDELSAYRTSQGKEVGNLPQRKAELSKLEPYRNTWHERVIREEVKKAAEDGKTKLQFPTGETAMKIEGLGGFDKGSWRYLTGEISPSGLPYGEDMTAENLNSLKPGQEVHQFSDPWIITDVLGDGKFKAIPKDTMQVRLDMDKGIAKLPIEDQMKIFGNSPSTETFDISGKVDTSNPIYQFYEKQVGRFLSNKYGAKLITDPQGVKWYELNVPKEASSQPIKAFGKAKIGTILGAASVTPLAVPLFSSTITAINTPAKDGKEQISYTSLPLEKKVSTLKAFADGIAKAETSIVKGDRYSYIHHNNNGTADYGKYAINDSFFESPGYMKRYANRIVTRAEVLASPALQDTIVKNFAHYWLSKGYPAKEIARMWTAGVNSSPEKTPRPQYVKNFSSIFNQ